MNCSVCNTSHRDTYAYKRHCNTTKHKANLEDPTKGVKCEHCGKKYQYVKSLNVHKKNCDVYLRSISMQTNNTHDLSTLDKRQLIERIYQLQKDAKIRDLENQLKISQLETKLATKNSKSDNNSNTTNNTTNNIDNSVVNNNITNNIIINAYGKENLDYITENLLLECVKQGYAGVPFLIKKIHNDPEHPENHNITIPNKKQNRVSIMGENGQWETKDRKETIEQAVYDASLKIRETYDDNKKMFPKSKQERFESYDQKLNDENEKELLKKIAKETDMAILDFKK